MTLAVLLSTACCAGANRGGGRADLDLADRYERGDGVPRDFRKAAEILARSCAEGRGIPSACYRLAYARARGRGVVMGQPVIPILTAACERGDWLACGVPSDFDEDHARAACEGREPAACVALADHHGWSDSGTIEEERHEWLARACRGGVLEGCLALVESGGERTADRTFAADRVTAACGRGHVDACAAAGRPISPRALCDAGDYGACAEAGGAGDGAALESACAAKVLEACEHIAVRAIDADPPDPRTVEYLARACHLGSDVACRLQRPDEISTGCVTYQPTVFAPATRRPLPHLHGMTLDGRPWTATAGTVAVLAEHEPTRPWSTYNDIARRLGRPVYVVVAPEELEDLLPPAGPAVAIVLAEEFAEEPIVAPPHPFAGVSVGKGIQLLDEHGAVLAVFSTGFEVVPATFARCVTSILDRP
ncbi:MAG: hypothetical protein R3B06_19925 [Kofleriaceae bacterium]